jgi:hypothetical protein
MICVLHNVSRKNVSSTTSATDDINDGSNIAKTTYEATTAMTSLKQIGIAFPAIAVVSFGSLLLPFDWLPFRGIGLEAIFVVGVGCALFGFFFGIGLAFHSGKRWLLTSLTSLASFGIVWVAYIIHSRVY